MAVQHLLMVGSSVVACGRTLGGYISPPINSILIIELIYYTLPIHFACLIMYIGPLVATFLLMGQSSITHNYYKMNISTKLHVGIGISAAFNSDQAREKGLILPLHPHGLHGHKVESL
jgi:hypothetical protein